MKEKIRKILFVIAEIGTVIWAIYEMYNYKIFTVGCGGFRDYTLNVQCVPLPHLGPIIFYFLSAILILYLLKKYERKN